MEKTTYSRAIAYLFGVQSFYWLSSNIIAPFLSIFLINEYSGVGLAEFGIANLIFFLSFGLLLPVIGKIEDKREGFADELMFLNWGILSRGVLFIMLALMDGVWALYMIHMLLGFSRALFSPSYRSLLTKFATSDKKSGTSYIFSLDESLVNILAAIGSGLSGYLALMLGSRLLIFVVGVSFIFPLIFSIPIKNFLKEKKILSKEQAA